MIAAAWIIFLPNAPYLVTDLVHLREIVSLPNAITLGLLAVRRPTAFKSVKIIQDVVEERFGATAGWHAVQFIAVLVAAGVYVGRVLRWNSWNVISHPQEMAQSVLNGLAEPGRVGLAFAVTGCRPLRFTRHIVA